MAKRNFWDRVSTALKAKDEAALKEAVEGKDGGELEQGEVSPGGGVTVHVHNGAAPAAAKAEDSEEETGGANKDDPLTKIADAITGLGTRMDDFGTRLEKLEGGKAADAESDEEDDDTTGATDAEGGEEADKDKNAKAKDGKSKAKDSVSLEPTFKDTVARAEILAPGIKIPAFDRKADPKTSTDLMCGLRRRALDKAFATDAGKLAIDPLLAGGKLDTKAMSCGETRILFNGASENMKRANNEDGESRTSAQDHGSVEPRSIGDINTKAHDFWAKRGGSPV
jgi:hypothetical protein